MSDPTPSPRTLFGFSLRALALLAALAVIASLALAVDLTNEGQVYDYLWEVTGETAPQEQLLGFGQYLVRYTRQQPDTEPYAQFQHNDVSPFGVNTFLEQEVEPEKRERQVQMIADAGFRWIRQQFPWEDIEIHAKGDFMDRRHVELHGEISAWDKYDNIVELAEQYDLDIIARLNGPMPVWSLPDGVINRFTPPADVQDFVGYAAAVAERYKGRIHHYQVWNEPNLYPEWGDQTVNAEAFTDLLCRTYAALKAVDPEIVVITGALGPTIDLSGRNAYDLLYLQRMYQAGAGACFDVLSVQGYGLWSGPTDRRLRQVTVNYQRHLWIRDMMVANGDANKPIWISEAGWNPVPNDPSIVEVNRYGRVTMAQAAAWAPLAYERALNEWPWIGVISWWYFKPADEHNKGDSSYYFRLVEPDFTPTPVYEALKAYITGEQPKPLGAGRWGIRQRGLVYRDESIERYTFRVRGTGVYLCYANAPEAMRAAYAIDGQTGGAADIPANATGCAPLAESLDAGEHLVEIEIPTGTGEQGFDSIVVVDYAARHRLPWLLTGIVAAGVVAVVLGCAVHGRRDR
jgi:hypothetical protein